MARVTTAYYGWEVKGAKYLSYCCAEMADARVSVTTENGQLLVQLQEFWGEGTNTGYDPIGKPFMMCPWCGERDMVHAVPEEPVEERP